MIDLIAEPEVGREPEPEHDRVIIPVADAGEDAVERAAGDEPAIPLEPHLGIGHSRGKIRLEKDTRK